METDALVIDESNFNSYFFDVRKNKPQQGQIMARYSAIAYFADGHEKQHMIDLLKLSDKARAAAQVMRQLHGAIELDSYRIPREMAEDLISGMPEKDVWKKAYKYNFEMFFYVFPQYMPKGDPHWTTVSILNVSDKVKIDLKGKQNEVVT